MEYLCCRMLSRFQILIFLVGSLGACGGHKGANQSSSPIPSPSGELTPNANRHSKYRPLTDAFPDPSDIMKNPDTVASLLKLREIASPTTEYQADLLALIKNVETTDLAHVKLLLEAVYFQFTTAKMLKQELNTLTKNGTDIEQKACVRARELNYDFDLALALGSSLDQIANEGFAKVKTFAWDETLAILDLLYPHLDLAEPAFTKAMAGLGPLDNDRQKQFMILASKKSQAKFASRLALDLFDKEPVKSIEFLKALVDSLFYTARDLTLFGAVAKYQSLEWADVKALVTLSYARRGEFASAAFMKLEQKSHDRVLELSAAIKPEDKEDFVTSILNSWYPTVSTSETEDLCALVPSKCYDYAMTTGKKWRDPTAANAVLIAKHFSYEQKNSWLELASASFKAMTTDDLITFLTEPTSDARLKFVKRLISIISDISGSNVARLCQTFTYHDKDDCIALFEPRLQVLGLKTGELGEIIQAAYLEQIPIAKRLFAKLTDLQAANATSIANLLTYHDRDTWLLMAAKSLKSLTAAEATLLLKSGYLEKLAIGKLLVDHIVNLLPSAAVNIATEVYTYHDRDAWLEACAPKWTTVKPDDLKLLIKGAYLKPVDIIISVLPRVFDLTVENTIDVAQNLTYHDKDRFLLRAIELVTNLNISNLDLLVNEGYVQKDQIRVQGIKRIDAH